MATDAETMFETIAKTLSTPVLSDVLDELGYRNQTLWPSIRPIDDSRMMIGRARTALYRDLYEMRADVDPYTLQIKLVDDLRPHEVAVIGFGGAKKVAVWGELLSTAALARGAAGMLTDGFVRDIRQIHEMGFPLFHAGISPHEPRGRGMITEIDIPIECGGVFVGPGDLIVGDADGVIVVPKAIEAKALENALLKVTGETETRDEVKRGVKLAVIYSRLGIL